MRDFTMMTQRLSRGVVSLLSGFILIILFSAPVYAVATVQVTTTDDEWDAAANSGDGECSLREAIETFNRKTSFGGCVVSGGFANTAADTIDFEDEAGTPDEYVLDRSGYGEDLNEFGDLDLTVSATIQGNEGETVITTDWDPADRDRVLHIYCETNLDSIHTPYEDCDPSIEVNIFDVTFQDGDVSGADGTNDPADGGGILFEDVTDGVAIPGVSELELEAVILKNNFALNGGGLAFKSKTLDILECEIFENTAGDRRDDSLEAALGGGVLAKGYAGDFDNGDDTEESSVFIEESSIFDNTARGAADAPLAAGAGVALAVIDEASISQTTINANRTEAAIITFGAGLFAVIVDYTDNEETLELDGVFLTENDGSDEIISFGGGMAVGSAGGGVETSELTVAHNLSASGGGIALFNEDFLFFQIIEAFDVLGDFSSIDLNESFYLFQECSIFNNEANGDPALAQLLGSILGGGGFDDLNLFGVGGGLFNFAGDVEIKNCTISHNRATFDGGGLFNGGIIGNTIDGDDAPAAMMITNATITLNQSHGSGGGIRNDSDMAAQVNDPDPADPLSVVSLLNTILADNLRFGGEPAQGDECFTDQLGEIESFGHNIFGQPVPPPDLITDCNLDFDLLTDQIIDPAALFVDILFPFVDSPGFYAEPGRQHYPLRGIAANIAIDEADETECVPATDLDEDQLDVDRVEIPDQGNDCVGVEDQCCDVGAIEYDGVCGDGLIDEVLGEECDDGGLCDDVNEQPCTTKDISNCDDPEFGTCEPEEEDGCDEECILEVCGNGKVQADEECDDGNDNNNDDCLDSCENAECGDGVTWNEGSGTEECDDYQFNTPECDSDCTFPDCGDELLNLADGEECDPVGGIPTAECTVECTISRCGDGILNPADPGEECDPPGGVPTADCNYDCTESFCGDGIYNPLDDEECDDGNMTNGDGCDDSCRLEVCGDGIVQGGEECEPDVDGSDVCDPDCTFAECGDFYTNTDAGEECDDGGLCEGDPEDPCGTESDIACDGQPELCEPVAGDGCNEFCQREGFCGDGEIGPGEICDDGGPSDQCNFDCTPDECGDGKVNAASGEQCDDGNTTPGDGCDAACQIEIPEFCGDGVVNGSEDCEPKTPGENDCDCNLNCTIPTCGDGILNQENGEACEDGNTVSGDGCSDTCVLERDSCCGNGVLDDGEFCDFTVPDTDPADCDIDCTAPECGDNVLNKAAGEECEDGNSNDGDGCSVECELEGPGDTDGPTEPSELGGCIGGGGCIFGACTESDENIDLSNVDLSFLSLYSDRSLQASRSNTYVLLFIFMTLGVIVAVRSRLAYRRK